MTKLIERVPMIGITRAATVASIVSTIATARTVGDTGVGIVSATEPQMLGVAADIHAIATAIGYRVSTFSTLCSSARKLADGALVAPAAFDRADRLALANTDPRLYAIVLDGTEGDAARAVALAGAIHALRPADARTCIMLVMTGPMDDMLILLGRQLRVDHDDIAALRF